MTEPEEVQKQHDFSELPEIVWAKIMGMLPLKDRHSLSLCCHALNDAFSHPSVWHTVKITLLGNEMNDNPIQSKQFAMVTKFANCFQDLTLQITGGLEYLSEEWLNVLIRLETSDCYHLQKLTLDVGETKTTLYPEGFCPNHSAVYALLGFIRSAFRLKCLVLNAWPIHRFLNYDKDIICTLYENEKLKDHLETLSLYWPKNSDWVTRNAYTPTLLQTKSLLTHMHALQHLRIRSNMIDAEVIEVLASEDHVPLKYLDVLVVHSPHYGLQVPEVPSASWLALKKHSPELKVGFSVMNRVNMIDLAAIMKPEVPIVSITFMKYSSCDGETLLSIATKYPKTLEKLIDFTSSEEIDECLCDLVNYCPKLNYLVCHSCVHFSTVQRLAALRGKNWEQFEFKESSIVTQDPVEDSDEVIGEKEPGVLYLKKITRFHESEDERQSRLSAMTESVCASVGYNWAPI